MSQVRQYLEMVARMKEQMTKADFPYRYKGVEALVLAEGIDYPVIASAQEADELLGRGETKGCYRNAWIAAMDDPSLTYVEGFAASIIPTQHAWVIDAYGVVYDNTWSTPGSEYLGIPIPTGTLRRITQRTGYFGVLDPTINPDILDGVR